MFLIVLFRIEILRFGGFLQLFHHSFSGWLHTFQLLQESCSACVCHGLESRVLQALLNAFERWWFWDSCWLCLRIKFHAWFWDAGPKP